MDPNEALAQLRNAFADSDYLTAEELFNALDEWLTKGGFLPDPWRVAAQDAARVAAKHALTEHRNRR